MVQILKRSFERQERALRKQVIRQEVAPPAAVISNAKWGPIAHPQTFAPPPVKVALSTSSTSEAFSTPSTSSNAPSSSPTLTTAEATVTMYSTVTETTTTAASLPSSPTSATWYPSTASSQDGERSSHSNRRTRSSSSPTAAVTTTSASSSQLSSTGQPSSGATHSFASTTPASTVLTSTTSSRQSTTPSSTSHSITEATITWATSTTATSSASRLTQTSSTSGALSLTTSSILNASALVTLSLTATDAEQASSYFSSVFASYTSRHSLSATSTASTSGMSDAPSPAPFTTKIKVFPTASESSDAPASTESGSSGGQSEALLNTFTKSPISITFTVFICIGIVAVAVAIAAFFVRRTHRRRKRERLGMSLGSEDNLSPRPSWRSGATSLYRERSADDVTPDAIWARRRESAAMQEMEEHYQEQMTEGRLSSEWTSIVGDRDFGSDFASSRGHGSFGNRGQSAPPMPLLLPTMDSYDLLTVPQAPHPLRNVHYPEPPTPSQYSTQSQSPAMLITPATPDNGDNDRSSLLLSPKSLESPVRPPRPSATELDYLPSDVLVDADDPFADHLAMPPLLRTTTGSSHSSSATRFAYMPSVLASRPNIADRPRYASSVLGSQSLFEHERRGSNASHHLRRAVSLAAARNSQVPLSPRHSTLSSGPPAIGEAAHEADDSISHDVGMAMTSDAAQWAYAPSQGPSNPVGLFKPDFLTSSPRVDEPTRGASMSRGSSQFTDTTVRPQSRLLGATHPGRSSLVQHAAAAPRMSAASSSSGSGRDSPAGEILQAMSASRRKVSLLEVIAASPATMRSFEANSDGSDESGGSDDSTTHLAKRRRSEQEQLAKSLLIDRRRKSDVEGL